MATSIIDNNTHLNKIILVIFLLQILTEMKVINRVYILIEVHFWHIVLKKILLWRENIPVENFEDK